MQEPIPPPTRVTEKAPGKVERVVTRVVTKAKELTQKGKEWFKDKWDKVTSKPREVLNNLNISVPTKIEDTYLVDSSEKTNTFPKIPEYHKENFRPLEKGESFEGGMPILDREETALFAQQAEILYGGEGKGSGKWGTVYLSGEKATKIFNYPRKIFCALEIEFMKKFGGIAGLPKFIGVVPNGYQMERFHGESLAKLVDNAFDKVTREGKKSSDVWKTILTENQVQSLLDKVAYFHKQTGRLHGDLAHAGNIVVSAEEDIRLVDPEWERIADNSPQKELKGLYDSFREHGYDNLTLPETISDEQARKNLIKFNNEVIENLELDLIFGNVVKYKDQKVKVKISEDGQVLISENKLSA